MDDDLDSVAASGGTDPVPTASHEGIEFGAIAELSRGFWGPRVLLSAVELELFTTLGGQSLTASQLATRLEADERGVDLLAKALVALGLLEVDEGRFSCSAVARRFLDGASPEFRGRVIRLANHWWDHWSGLTEVVSKGSSAVAAEWTGDGLEDFTLAMHQGKPDAGEMLVAKLDLHGIERIVDLGGGAGTFSEALAVALPAAEVVLVDRPEVIAIARQRLPAELVDERIVLVERDFMVEGIPLAGSRPGGYDLALISSLLHLNGPRDNATLLSRVYDALEPGGHVVIREFLIDDSGTVPTDAALFALTMLVTTSEGRCYSYSQMREWLHQAGFGEVEQQEFDGPIGLVTARRA